MQSSETEVPTVGVDGRREGRGWTTGTETMALLNLGLMEDWEEGVKTGAVSDDSEIILQKAFC